MTIILKKECVSQGIEQSSRRIRLVKANSIMRIILFATVLAIGLCLIGVGKIDAKRDFFSEYSKLIDTLRKNGIEVSEQFRKNAMSYINYEGAKGLIRISPNKPGLTWSFYDIVFLRKDLILVSYDDGEMTGGDLLIKVDYKKEKILNMQTLWDSSM